MKDDINICFLMGRIISEIDFKFFYNSKKHVSRVRFLIEIYKGNTIIELNGYDNIADIVYKNFDRYSLIQIVGFFEKGQIVISEVYK